VDDQAQIEHRMNVERDHRPTIRQAPGAFLVEGQLIPAQCVNRAARPPLNPARAGDSRVAAYLKG
jgi:hypothetical protein